MYAIIKDRGKQYKVRTGERHFIDLKADAQIGETLEFNDVLIKIQRLLPRLKV